MAKVLPTQARLAELFADDGDTLRRIVAKGKAAAGDRCVGLMNSGYYRVRVDGVYYLVHRLLWVLRYGGIPDGLDVDHRNGVLTDNTDVNLRLVTHGQNMQNSRKPANNTSGVTGVSWSKAAAKWLVQLRADGEYHYGGVYSCFNEACAAAAKLREEHHGAYARR